MTRARVALVSPPTPGGRYVNRDLYAGMGIRDDFGTAAGASFVAFLKAEGTVVPELALATLAAQLREHEVRVFDGARVPPSGQGDFEAAIARFAPTWLIASTSYAALCDEVAFVGRVRAACSARAVVFGYAAHAFAADVLATGGVDFVVAGEPEAVLPGLLRGADPAATPGLWFREGAAVRTTGTALVDDLDALPIPDWGALPLARYRYFPLLKQRPFATILSSRGCSYGCDYCPYAVAQGLRFRAMSPGRVVDELAELAGRWGVRAVLFRDPSFGLDRQRVLAICEGLAARGLSLEWGCETRLDGLDDEVQDALARAGCRSVEIGLDSVSPAALAQNRRVSMGEAEVRARLQGLRRRGIDSAGLFVLGLPGDDQASIRATLDLACRLPLTWLNFELPVPFPGTAMTERAVRQGVLTPPRFEDLRGQQPPLLPRGLDLAALQALQSDGVRRFYVSPRRVLRSLQGGGALASAAFLGGSAVHFLGDRLAGFFRPTKEAP